MQKFVSISWCGVSHYDNRAPRRDLLIPSNVIVAIDGDEEDMLMR